MGADADMAYLLNPAMPVLMRPDGTVQIGWHPRRAVVVRPPAGLTTSALATLLRAMKSPITVTELGELARRAGPARSDELESMIGQLVAAGVAEPVPHRARRHAASIRVHGRGPLSDLMVSALRCSGAVVRQSSGRATAMHDTDLVVLADYLAADPHVVRDLHHTATPHLSVRVRDGTGLVGPMVIPGVTSCLACADLHRSEHDAAWPAVADQLRDTVGSADRATMLATAALAINQVDRVLRVLNGSEGRRRPEPPPTLDTTLEFDVCANSIVARRWTRHPRCFC